MDKKYVFVAIIAVLATITGLALLYFTEYGAPRTEACNASQPEPGYIGSTRIYLIESNLSYDRFKDSYFMHLLDHYFYIQGEPCAVVRGAIRNDGANDSWVGISATVYDKNGRSVGTVITRSTKPWFQTVFVESNGTESFEIPVKYGKKDVTRYEFILNWGPDAYPPP